jgi:hypothetical protein
MVHELRLIEVALWLTWQLPAAKVIHAVHAHHATMKPTKRACLRPALSAAQI